MFNGIYAAQNKQSFLFNGEEVETSGNPLAHVILRGATNEYGKMYQIIIMTMLSIRLSNMKTWA